ncbi:efflux RND transporter periplasmic adaptor subunit [Ulvibacterium sp.]|uniref:efflux RND transporter periplasmic adaptor subunit n=1 Tax=Ulvibacterium sp. TaxID=2665914 RepID=UPI003BADAE86
MIKAKLFTVLLGTLVLLSSSCGDGNTKQMTDESSAVQVSVSPVLEENGSPFLTASGKIEAIKSANLSTRIMGHVDKIHVQVGDKVRIGQLLLSINNADLSAKLAQANANIAKAKAAFRNAEKDFVRYTNLFNENSASRKELDDATANYHMANARQEAAEQMKSEVNAQFPYAHIKAPFNGVVTNRFINVGDMAHPGMTLLEVEAPGSFQVWAMVPESEISKVKLGVEVDVVLKSMDKTVKGKVVEISTSAKNTGGQYLVKVVLQKSGLQILSGMYATVQFPIKEETMSQAVFVPLDAIVKRGQLSGIYTVSQSNTAVLRWLRLGRTSGEKVEVLSGLSTDEHYIIAAQGKLYNGARISIR